MRSRRFTLVFLSVASLLVAGFAALLWVLW